MEQDLDYLKTVIRSILTSSPNSVTISQLLNDFKKLEGAAIPHRNMGYNTVFELLETMTDVLKIPSNPNMNSYVKLIVDKKTEHLRDLVINQKNKRTRSRIKKHGTSKKYSPWVNNNIATTKYGNNGYLAHQYDNNSNEYNSNVHGYNRNIHSNNNSINRHFGNNPHVFNYNSRGYNFIKSRPLNSPKPKGFVTKELRESIENLCSQNVSVSTLKYFLRSHRDYHKLNAANINEAINDLKYFIYIDKNGVHLKNSLFEIFPSNKSEIKNVLKPNFENILKNITDDDQELIYDDDTDTGSVDDDDEIRQSQIINSSTRNAIELSIDELQLKHKDILIEEMRNENIAKLSTPYKLLECNIKSQDELEEKKFPEFLNVGDIDYKSAIVSIIEKHDKPVTVIQVLNKFESIYGYSFPYQQFSCRSYMDFFRLYPSLFNLNDPYSTNSIIHLEQQDLPKRMGTIRKYFINARVDMCNNNVDNVCENDSEKISPIKMNHDLSLNTSKPIQSEEHFDNKNFSNTNSVEAYEVYDSDMILNSMKDKMRYLLGKHKDGIPCNDFMDVYANEFNGGFTFSEYGFKSMSDMAYKLPSVFFVKTNEDNTECVLYDARRRNELDNGLNDPSLYYKNIPKTILYNLSKFFNYNRTVNIKDVMRLYCSEFGRSYEPLKYGYSSERHMFESLNKMVKFDGDTLLTLDPFAYVDFEINTNSIEAHRTSDLNKKDYTIMKKYIVPDVCIGEFVYSELQIDYTRLIKVVAAEIYSPVSFYLNLDSNIDELNTFMDSLQKFYTKRNAEYTILPHLITTGLACASIFEDSNQWHRAKVLKIIDEHKVQVIYVDYGSIDIVQKSSIRLLALEFGTFPMQALHCSLYGIDEFKCYCTEMKKFFVYAVENKLLEARFSKSEQKSQENDQKMMIKLYGQELNCRIDINKFCVIEFKKLTKVKKSCIRRLMAEITSKDF